MFRILGVLSVVLLAGCASLDRAAMTEFEPLDGGRFRYVSSSDVFYPLDSTDAEATRIEWLEMYLADNGICPDGYAITDRKAVQMNDYDIVHKIYYYGECN